MGAPTNSTKNNQMLVKCVICGKICMTRNSFVFNESLYPRYHINEQTKNPCHGFFTEGEKFYENFCRSLLS